MFDIEKVEILVFLNETFLATFIQGFAFAYCRGICQLLMLKNTFKFDLHHSIVIVISIQFITFFIHFIRWIRLTLLFRLYWTNFWYLDLSFFYYLFLLWQSLLYFLFLVFSRFPFMHPTFCQFAAKQSSSFQLPIL